MLWAALAFIPQTRPIYMHWRGEWGLLSFMIVCAMTLGATNTAGLSRIMGSLVGAVVAVAVWALGGGNAAGLSVLGAAASFAAYCVILAAGRAPLGRISLLTYNVTVLYAYSLTQKVSDPDDDEGGLNPLMYEIVMHRVVAISAGVLYGWFVCRVVWPISARRRFKEGIAVLYLQMGLIWRRGPLAILLRWDCTRSYLKSGEQLAMQRYGEWPFPLEFT